MTLLPNCRDSFFGLDLKSGNVTVGLDGNALNSFTAQSDIGRYVAYVLTNLPRSKLEWRIFRIEGDRKVRNRPWKLFQRLISYLAVLQPDFQTARRKDREKAKRDISA